MIVSVPITLKEEDRLNRVEKNLKNCFRLCILRVESAV